MKQTKMSFWSVMGSLIVLISCVACGPKKVVERIESDTIIDLSGRWNDTDSRQVSQAMILDCLNHPWITNHATSSRLGKPVVIVGAIRNRSMEHVPIGTFVNDIERAFINSGRVSVVANSIERDEIRAEKEDQKVFSSLKTIKEMGLEYGADYMMTGEINSIEDREGGTQITYYQVDLALTNIETNEKIWLGQKKIKKIIERKRISF